MKLVVITPPTLLGDETKTVNTLFEKGLQWLHLRKPAFSLAGHRQYLLDIDPAYHEQIVMHGCFELFGEFGLGGIHLSSRLREDNAAKESAEAYTQNISSSFHSWREIEDGGAHYAGAFISPVFNSISKPGYLAAIDIGAANDVRQKLLDKEKHCPCIIGLGGVGAVQIKVLHENGFDGAALLGAIWMAEDPVAAFMGASRAALAVSGPAL